MSVLPLKPDLTDGLIDSHCHLDFDCFDLDRESLINSLSTQGVIGAVVPSVNADNWQNVLDLSAQYCNIFPALGIHPCFLDGITDNSITSHIDDLTALISNNKVVAIGECGLDFTLDNVDLQREYFVAQIGLAKQFKLPLIVHHRKSHDSILALLRRHKPEQGGVIHAFSGSYQQAMQYIDLGFKLGIGGTITYERAKKTRTVVSKVALDCLMLETDAPDMPISGRQGQRNSPAYLHEIFLVLAALREEPADEVARQLLETTMQMFGLRAKEFISNCSCI